VTEEEVEFVAEELAKVGGVSWYPGREPGPILRVVSDRYRDRARVAISALERFRAANGAHSVREGGTAGQHRDKADQGQLLSHDVRVGATVIYRPPGDRRAYPCRIDKIEDGRAYLIPLSTSCTYSVLLGDPLPPPGSATFVDKP
jgi:hypothetical protein